MSLGDMENRLIPSRRGLLSGAAVTLAFAGAARSQTPADAPTYRNEVEGYGALVPDHPTATSAPV